MAEEYGLQNKYGTFEDDYTSCLRLIDWKRGKPYVWRSEDYEEILHSSCLFARKFDQRTDSAVIMKIGEIQKM
jgi:hypothetical protein